MAMDEGSFAVVHVVSDLHLAGVGSSQIFKGSAELSALVGAATQDALQRRVAFVINGDFVDFLAAREATYFDPANAVDKLNDVIAAFADVWAAFRSFVAQPNARLVVVLGNHDLELSLPRVKEAFLEAVAGSDHGARGRVWFHMDGAGFETRVLGQRVLCVHGNDVDLFNVVDYERLEQLQRGVQRGEDDWVPNAGTKLVIDVMNGIKRTFPFVDLLKPETELVLPVLFALNQATRERLVDVLAVGGRYTLDKVRRGLGLLSVQEPAQVEKVAADRNFDDFLLETFPRGTEPSNGSRRRTLMRRAEQSFRDGRDPLDLIRAQREAQLGYFGALRDAIRGKTREEILLQALERVQRDQSFDPHVPDDTFRALDRKHDTDARVLIAGHTHLERLLRRSKGAGVYMNTGTWARLMRLRPDDLISTERFRPVFAALQSKTMADLDVATPSRIVHRPTVASVWDENGSFCCALRRVRLDAGRVAFDDVRE